MKIDLLRKEECIAYIELNVTGDNVNYIRCHSESFYIKNEVFNLITTCFEKSHELYEFFGATKYNSRKVIPLKNELEKSKELYGNFKSLNAFKKHVKGIFLGETFFTELKKTDNDWEKNWRKYVNQLVELHIKIIEIIMSCIEHERVLWVIGL